MGRFRTGLVKSVNRTKAWGSKHSPEILIGIGIVSSVAAVGLAIKATIDIRDEWDDLTEDIDEVKFRYNRDEETYECDFEDEDGEVITDVLEGEEAVKEYRRDLA